MNWNNPKERALAMIRGKGWSVTRMPRNGKVYFKAVARKNQRNYLGGGSSDFQEAVALAIALAVKNQCINWTRTKEWLETAGLEVPTEAIVRNFNRQKGDGRYGRGWSVTHRRARKPGHSESWTAMIGAKRNTCEFSVRAGSMLSAVRKAVRLAKTKPYYGEAATRAWLEKRGLEDKVDWKVEHKIRKAS